MFKLSNCKKRFIKDRLPENWSVVVFPSITLILFFYAVAMKQMINRNIEFTVETSIQYYSYLLKPIVLPLVYLSIFLINTIINMIIYDPVELKNTYNFGYNSISAIITLVIALFRNYFVLTNINDLVISLLLSIIIFILNFSVNERLTVCFLSLTDSIR